MILAWGSFYICSGIYIKTVCRSKSTQKHITLTFDDGPHPEFSPAVLDLLKKNNIRAGFFLIGKHIENNEDIVRRISDEGHLIGNHSYAHANSYGFWGTKKLTADLRRNEELIGQIIGKRVRLFRPPFGVTNPNIAKAARKLDYTVMGWSLRSLDGMSKSKEKIIKRVIRRLEPGKVILFHDNHEGIVPILEEVIRIANTQGYTFVSPDELLNIKAYK
jgi:peptidoglycan/xylan/chitin deacetylase (PgdA/CDA1 family)